MHAPIFWLCLIAIIAFGIVRGIIQAYNRQAAAQAVIDAEKDRKAAEHEDRLARIAERSESKRRTKGPSFPAAEEPEPAPGTCTTCADPNHWACSGEADCPCCQHTLQMLDGSNRGGEEK